MEALPIIILICAVAFATIFAIMRPKKAQESSATPMPKSEELYVPEVTPVAPVERKRAVVIFEDTFRSVRVCPQCDGENDCMARHCRVCGGKL